MNKFMLSSNDIHISILLVTELPGFILVLKFQHNKLLIGSLWEQPLTKPWYTQNYTSKNGLQQ